MNESLFMNAISPTFMEFINGIVKIGNTALVIDDTHRVDSTTALKVTTYGIRHDPKIDTPPSVLVDSLIELFYKHYKLQDKRYTNMRLKFILTTFRIIGSELQPNTKLIPSSNHNISNIMSMHDIYVRDEDMLSYVSSVKTWIEEKIGECRLYQIKLQVEDYGK